MSGCEVSLLAQPSFVIPQVTFGRASPAVLPPYNPIEVINYFVMVEHENELARY